MIYKKLDQLKSDLLAEFVRKVQGKGDDALFDRAGNNVSRQVGALFSSALDTIAEKTVEAMKIEIIKDIEKSARKGVAYEPFKRDKWLGGGRNERGN